VQRAEDLRRIFRGAEHISQCVHAIWPSLALVSCWADGPSLVHANNLRQYLPTVEIQPKGLLATEAFVTVPLLREAAPALAIRSHFFEFQSAGVAGRENDSRPLLAHELVEGRRHRVIVTSGGGLYRYQLQDEVEVTGFMDEVPLLRFVGKTDDVSDLVGEKLSAAHVGSILQAAFHELQLTPTFSQVRPDHASPPCYVLELTATALGENPPLQERLGEIVETGLANNPGYRYARATGQLGALKIKVLSQQQADAVTSNRIVDRLATGKRLGDIKTTTFCG